MIPPSRTFTIGSKPWIRVLSILSATFVFFSLSKWLLVPDTTYSSGLSTADRLRSAFSRPSPLKYTSYRYEAPQDLVIYPKLHSSIEAESFIAKVTILFHGKDPTYIRAIQTHQTHNRRFGYPLLVLRHAILEGIWSKPAYLLAIMLEELRKPEGERLKWLLCACC